MNPVDARTQTRKCGIDLLVQETVGLVEVDHIRFFPMITDTDRNVSALVPNDRRPVIADIVNRVSQRISHEFPVFSDRRNGRRQYPGPSSHSEGAWR